MLKPHEFVHLHCHTEFSMLDGAARIPDLVAAVKEAGQRAVAITDHGVLHGAYYLWDECTKGGKLTGNDVLVKPIIGVEAYVTPGTSRFDTSRVFFAGPYGDSFEDRERRKNDVSASGSYTHMTLWAENNQGLENLNWMQTRASIDRAFGKQARIDRDLLAQYSKGLLGTTGCPSGAVQTYLRLGMYKEALREASEMQDIFGKGNFWVELMDHGIEFERSVMADLIKIAKEIGAPLLATNDLHYVKAEDAIAQDALLCINSASSINDPDRFKFDGSGYYVKSTQEMFEIFKELPNALTNTLEVAERCNVDFQPKQGRFMPHVPIPDGKTEEQYFREQVILGMKFRFPDGVSDDYQKQVAYEVSTILDMGFPSYFLVVSDFVRWAKDNDIFVGPGRGSAAGSLVAYAMQITDLDPIEHKLIFERFLNPERVSLPDIDIDFENGGRERVIQYCAEKYGEDNVAQIITFDKLKAKQALRDAARIMDYDVSTGDTLSKNFPEGGHALRSVIQEPRKKKDGETAAKYNEYMNSYRAGEEFRELLNAGEDDDKYKKVADMAVHLEGLTRGWGVHASGVIVSSDKIANVCPTMRRSGDDAIITQFEAHGCEDLGFVKMDFLGLKNLNTNKTALKNIELVGKPTVDLLKIPLDDPKTFKLIGDAETLGVFQLDGEGMRTLLKRMKPTKFDDISATIALFRPGPMGMNAHNDYADRKNKRKPIVPIHPEVDEALKDILDDTYGLVVFQEQIQFAARKLAGFSLGEADILRRAMGKKIKAELDAQYSRFESGMLANGYSKAAVKAVWDVFEPFADYAFNRAHTACYGFNAYTNAYLKANYPVEYMAALLTTNEKSHTQLGLYLAECARMGIKVDTPDINRSQTDFAPDGKKILFGLGAVHHVGAQVAEEIIKAREEKGQFTDFNDFLYKVPESVLNKLKLESLIKAGAFDSLGYTRRSLMAIRAEAVEVALPVKRKEAAGQFDLFGALGVEDATSGDKLDVKVPDLEEFDKRTKLDYEKDMLGLYVSDHPLGALATALSNQSDFPLLALNDVDAMKSYRTTGTERHKSAQVAGMISTINRRISKKSGKPWALVTLEDLTGSTNISLFGKMYEESIDSIQADQIVQVDARVQVAEDGTATLTAQKFTQLNLSVNDEIKDVTLRLSGAECTSQRVAELKEIISRYPGEHQVVLEVEVGPKNKKHLVLPDDLRTNPTSSFWAEVKALFAI
jgi:DNA polymerase-3 subunit alpha